MGNSVNRNSGPISICEYIENILIRSAQHIGFQKESAKKTVFVCLDEKTTDGVSAEEILQKASYCQNVELSASSEEKRVIRLGSLLDANHPAQFLLCTAVDALSAWLAKAALEEGLESLMGGDYRFPSRTGQPMNEVAAAVGVFNQMSQNVTSFVQELLNFPVSLLESLSLEKYEGEPVSGDLVIAFCDKVKEIRRTSILWTPEGFDENTDVYLEEESIRHVVKLMAGCEEDPVLFEIGQGSGAPRFVGCVGGNRLEDWEKSGEDVVRIRIEGQMNYAFYLRGKLLFRSSFHGLQADLQEEEQKLNQQLLRRALEEEFPSLDSDSIERLMASLVELQRQQHGTAALIVHKESCTWNHICDLAKQKKATRVRFAVDLRKAGVKGNPLTAAARMDGAIVMETEGSVGFLMTILDGESCIAGDLSRGARYNSVRNFVSCFSGSEENPEEILGVVFSSDGSIDVLPGKKLSSAKNGSPLSRTS